MKFPYNKPVEISLFAVFHKLVGEFADKTFARIVHCGVHTMQLFTLRKKFVWHSKSLSETLLI